MGRLAKLPASIKQQIADYRERSKDQWKAHQFYQSINQSSNQTNNQSFYQSIKQSIGRSIARTISHPAASCMILLGLIIWIVVLIRVYGKVA